MAVDTAAVAATTAIAAVNVTAARAASQGGIFEGLNPIVYNAADPLMLFTVQATIVIALTRLLYWPLSKVKEPRVIAEVLTGIILGPSVMGRIPGFTAAIFPPAGMAPFRLAANIGLTLFLFLVGLEINITYLLSNWRVAASVACLDMGIPFGLGIAIAYGLYHEFGSEPGLAPISFGLFALFVGIAMAITAFPVLCRILTSLKLLNTSVGVIVLTSGIANDVIGWTLLALCVTLVNAGAGLTTLWILLTTVGFSLFLAYGVRPVFMWTLRRTRSLEDGPTQGVVALTIFLVLAAAFFTNSIGVHSIFGAFMVGLMCPHEGGFAVKLTEKIEDLISTLFVPLFFALSGINTNLALLDNGKTWGYVIAITTIAFASKIVGGALGARMNGMVWRESITIGTLMSCKGLVELIVLNIGLQAKILSTRTFTMFVVMALVTTFATAPLVAWLYPPWYQQKLDLWRKGKIDWAGNPILPPDSDDQNEEDLRGDVASRFLVYLRADGLSGLISIVSLFTSGQSNQPVPGNKPSSTHGSDHGNNGQSPNSGGSERNQTPPGSPVNEKKAAAAATSPVLAPSQMVPPQKLLRFDGYRLIELGERNSSVMKVSEIEEYAGHDPIVKAFGTAAGTYATGGRDVLVSGRISVVPEDSFADTLATQASRTDADVLLVPWSESGTVSELSSFYGHSASSPRGDPLANREFADLVGDIFEKGKRVTGVAVFVDKSLVERTDISTGAASSSAEKPRLARQLTRDAVSGVSLSESHDPSTIKFYSAESRGRKAVRVLYAGSRDDLLAVRLALQLLQNANVEVTIVEAQAQAFGHVPSRGIEHDARLANDLEFGKLKALFQELYADRVNFTEVNATHEKEAWFVVHALLTPQPNEIGSVIFLLGRSLRAGGGKSPASAGAGSSSAAAESSSAAGINVLGPVAAALATEIKKGDGVIAGSLLVVQAKEAKEVAKEEGKRKASMDSQESGR